MIGALAEQIDRDHRLRLQAERLCAVAMPRLSEAGIHVEGRFIDVDEYRRRAGQRHRLAGRTEGKGRTEHRIARADALRHQHHQQRIGAAGAGHDMLGAAERGELGLELQPLPDR